MRTYDRPSIRKKLEQIDANKLNCSSTPDLIECAIADSIDHQAGISHCLCIPSLSLRAK